MLVRGICTVEPNNSGLDTWWPTNIRLSKWEGQVAMCVHALWEIFCDFVVAIARIMWVLLCMHYGIVGKFLQFHCSYCWACELCYVLLWENFCNFVAAIARIIWVVLYALCWHCRKFSVITLQLLPSMWVVAVLCAWWGNFCDFIAAVAEHVGACIVEKFLWFCCSHCWNHMSLHGMHCGNSAILLQLLLLSVLFFVQDMWASFLIALKQIQFLEK